MNVGHCINSRHPPRYHLTWDNMTLSKLFKTTCQEKVDVLKNNSLNIKDKVCIKTRSLISLSFVSGIRCIIYHSNFYDNLTKIRKLLIDLGFYIQKYRIKTIIRNHNYNFVRGKNVLRLHFSFSEHATPISRYASFF